MPKKRPAVGLAKREQPAPLPAAKVLTAKDLAEYLKVHRSTIYRVGSDWRFNVEEIDAWRLGFPISQLGTGDEDDDD